jgi:imidazole glycerol-phosphate synthase subunit HisH
MNEIAVLNLGISNTNSVLRMINSVGYECRSVSDADEITNEKIFILPGVGHFSHGIKELRSRGYDELITQYQNNPDYKILGICLGMQLLFQRSDEGNGEGLGIFEGEIKKITVGKFPRHYNIGWRDVQFLDQTASVEEIKFYFLHGYYAECVNEADIWAQSIYGHPFTCAVSKNSVTGVQFHPEKSHRFGKEFFRNYFHGV